MDSLSKELFKIGSISVNGVTLLAFGVGFLLGNK